jgi:VanZ family protein
MTAASADVERAFAFAMLGGAIALGYFRHRDLLVGILFALVFSAFLEAGQNFVPGRHGEMHDFMVKALAVVVGVVAVWILRRVRRTRRQP